MPPRLVVVSNRVPVPAAPDEAGTSVGGLVAAVEPAVQEVGGLWLGWSGDMTEEAAPLHHARRGAIDLATVDLTAQQIARYYDGFANGTLWPFFHGFTEKIRQDRADFEVYRDVDERFAELLRPLLRPGDLVWVQDYHLMLVGAALRARGWDGALGYFHHVPMPPGASWGELEEAAIAILDALPAFSLVGVQTHRDESRLRDALRDRDVRIIANPIGTDPEGWRGLAAMHPQDPFAATARGRPVVFGVDRLDYSKGIPLRIEAYGRFLQSHPEWRDRVRFEQWCAPSRQSVPAYREELAAVERLVAGLAAEEWFGEDTLHFDLSVHPASEVAAGYRQARVCLVTSLADGMNLVAKEFVAVQPPADPGVLVLSRGCGAAEELTEALLVAPGDLEGTAEAVARALEMPLEERIARWEALHSAVEANTALMWRDRFVRALAE